MNTTHNNRSLATLIAESEGYAGGYLYPGAIWSCRRPDTDNTPRFAPQLRNRVHFTKRHDHTPVQDYAVWNKKVLAALPVGSQVFMHSSLCGGKTSETWEKVGPCKWTLTYMHGVDDREHQTWTPAEGWTYEPVDED